MSDQYSTSATQLLLKALDHKRRVSMTLRSDSMAPLLRRGDQIQIAPITTDGPDIGDVVVFGASEDLVAHRFWGVRIVDNRTYLLTRGDRLAFYDPFTPQSQLRAVVIGRRRNGRLLALNQGAGALLNHSLTRLAQLEARVMRIPLPTSPSGPAEIARYGLVRRAVRRLLVMLARLLTSLAG